MSIEWFADARLMAAHTLPVLCAVYVRCDVYVCVHVCVYVCVHVYVYCMCVHRMCVYGVYVCASCVCLCVCLCVYCVCVCVCVYVCVCLCVCVCVCVYGICVSL